MGACLSGSPPPQQHPQASNDPAMAMAVVTSPFPYPSPTPSPEATAVTPFIISPKPQSLNRVADIPLDDPRKDQMSVIPSSLRQEQQEKTNPKPALSAGAVTMEDGAPDSDHLSVAGLSSCNRLNALLIDRALSKHRVVDIDLLPPPATGISNVAEDDTVGGHSRRNTWNPSAPVGTRSAPSTHRQMTPDASTPILVTHHRFPSNKLDAASVTVVAPSAVSNVGQSGNSSPMYSHLLGVVRARVHDESPERTPSVMSGLPAHLMRQGSNSARDVRSGMNPSSTSATSSPFHGASMDPHRAISPSSFVHKAQTARAAGNNSRPESPGIDRAGEPIFSLEAPPFTDSSFSPPQSPVCFDESGDPRGMVLNSRRHHTVTSLGGPVAFQSLALASAHTASASSLHASGGNTSPVPAGRRSTRGRSRGRKLALIVDSNTLTQRLTSVALYRCGFTACDVATDGESAAQMSRSQRYDLILMDAHLPSMSGVETAKWIRSYEQETQAEAAAPNSTESPSLLLALTVAVNSDSLNAYKLAGFNGAIERGAILVEAVLDAMDTLQRNPTGFIFLPVGGTKVQQVTSACTSGYTSPQVSRAVSPAPSPMLSAIAAPGAAPHSRMPSTSLRRDPQFAQRRATGGGSNLGATSLSSFN